jgi:Protein of unknown function (DUF732)
LKVTTLASMLAAGAALVAGIAVAAPAHADPGTITDDNFLAALKNAGITYRDGYQVVAAGQAVCGLMDNGRSGIDVVSDVQKFNPGFTLDGAARFAAIAAQQYCPHHLDHANG